MKEELDKETEAIREVAADWVVRWSTGDMTPQEEEAFFDWLRRSPLHVQECLLAEAAWLALDDVAAADSSDIETLLRGLPDNVVELQVGQAPAATSPPGASEQQAVCKPMSPPEEARSSQPATGPTATGLNWRFPWSFQKCAAAVAAVMICVVSVSMLMPVLDDWLGTEVLATQVGEQRRMTLADGSVVELNTASKLRVRLRERSRDIFLDAGEAFFEVAHDEHRPFRVFSGTAVVRAVGTQFNVYRKPDRTVVTVVEGRVAVTGAAAAELPRRPVPDLASDRPAAVPLPSVELAAGEKIAVTSSIDQRAVLRTESVDPQAAVAWREHRLVFDDNSLADVIAEFNRYNRQQLVIDSEQLAAVRISGIFDPNKPQALVRFLVQQGAVQPVELREPRVLLAPVRKDSEIF